MLDTAASHGRDLAGCAAVACALPYRIVVRSSISEQDSGDTVSLFHEVGVSRAFMSLAKAKDDAHALLSEACHSRQRLRNRHHRKESRARSLSSAGIVDGRRSLTRRKSVMLRHHLPRSLFQSRPSKARRTMRGQAMQVNALWMSMRRS